MDKKTKGRPSIPAAVQRQIFIEAGHRCAVCGTPFPLERAHIISWSKSKDHSAENLICLCANCHERADKDWDQITLREYKEKPWVLRKNDVPPSLGKLESKRKIKIRIDMPVSSFDPHKHLLQHALASFLDVPADDVKITEIEEGSTIVTVELDSLLARRLMNALRDKDPWLADNLSAFTLTQIVADDEIKVRGTVPANSEAARLVEHAIRILAGDDIPGPHSARPKFRSDRHSRHEKDH